MSLFVKFIYNPYAGENKILSCLDYIFEMYQRHNYVIIPYRLTNESDIDKALDGINSQYHHILIAGGDGTINSVVNSIKQRGIDLPIAVLPAGTANDFAKLLGYSSNIRSACRQILEGEITNIDIGLANGSYFINVLSAGLFTEISQKTPTILKNTFGKLAYYFSSIQELPNFKKIHIKVDSEDVSFDDNSLIIFVFNGRTAGNMNFGYRSDMKDGLLDVLIITGDNIVDTIVTVFHFISRNERQYPRGVVHFKSKRFRITSDDDLTVDIDGEQGPSLPIEISCIENGLSVIVPQR